MKTSNKLLIVIIVSMIWGGMITLWLHFMYEKIQEENEVVATYVVPLLQRDSSGTFNSRELTRAMYFAQDHGFTGVMIPRGVYWLEDKRNGKQFWGLRIYQDSAMYYNGATGSDTIISLMSFIGKDSILLNSSGPPIIEPIKGNYLKLREE